MNYSRSGKTYKDRTELCASVLIICVVVAAFFVAAGGLELFVAEEDPELSQLYRLTVVITPNVGEIDENFQLDVLVFNLSVIADRFNIIAHNGTPLAKATGNLLWSLNMIDGIVLEISATIPVDFGFRWHGTINSADVEELPPSDYNKYHWYFDYGLYGVDIQLGPRYDTGDS